MFLCRTRVVFMLLVVPLFAEAQIEKTLLCIQENSSVFYQLFKRSSDGDMEKWQVYITVEHHAVGNLYYMRAKTRIDRNAPVTVEGLLPFAPYVTIQIQNAYETGTFADQKYFLCGKVTLHVGPKGKSIFRVPNHSDHTFDVLVKKGEGPILIGKFNTTLSPLDSLKAYRGDLSRADTHCRQRPKKQ